MQTERKSHVCHSGDKVLLKKVWKIKFNQDACKGPYTVTEVQNKGMTLALKNSATDTYKLSNDTTFKE